MAILSLCIHIQCVLHSIFNAFQHFSSSFPTYSSHSAAVPTRLLMEHPPASGLGTYTRWRWSILFWYRRWRCSILYCYKDGGGVFSSGIQDGDGGFSTGIQDGGGAFSSGIQDGDGAFSTGIQDDGGAFSTGIQDGGGAFSTPETQLKIVAWRRCELTYGYPFPMHPYSMRFANDF